MANNKELKNLQEDLGPYYHQPLHARRSYQLPTGAGDSGSEPGTNRPNTPESKSAAKRQGPSSRDSTPGQSSRPRSRGKKTSHRHSLSRDSSTPKRSPKLEPPPSQVTPSRNPLRPSPQMSQRNRSGRGSNRNNGNSHGEEAQIWEQSKAQFQEIIASINQENENLGQLVNLDKQAGALNPDDIPGSIMQQMEQLCRAGVKLSDANMASIKALIDQLKILRAVVVAKEQAEQSAAGPSKRAARDSAATAAAASSLYDFDAAGDSPVPSPIGSSRKFGDRASNRDSVPPKADSVEPQGSSGSGTGGPSGPNAKSKVVFSKGDEVAFKPRAVNGEPTSDWILGEVAAVLGDGKSRRYKVLDVEPDDQSKQKEYRSSASSMIPITAESQAATLKDWESGKVVLALYPNTTTFYKAEVHSTVGDKVNLKFEGENDSTTLQQVERRFVIEYRA